MSGKKLEVIEDLNFKLKSSSRPASPDVYSAARREFAFCCVDCLILDDSGELVLLTRRAIEPYIGMWHFPGGIVRFGESLKEACRRVVKEEVDLQLSEIAGPLTVCETSLPERHDIAFAYLCRTLSAKSLLKKSHQHLDAKWFRSLPDKMVPHQRLTWLAIFGGRNARRISEV